MSKKIVTNSSLALLRECPRKFEHRYEQEIVPNHQDDEALNYGTIIHNALERYYKGESLDQIKAGLKKDIDSTGAEEGQREEWAVHALATIEGYIARYPVESEFFEVIECERLFSGLPVRNPATGAASRSFLNSGKLDMVVRRKSTGMLWLVEHKTTGSSIDDRYFAKCEMDMQIIRYVRVVQEIYGEQVEGVLYNVIGKYKTKRKAAETQEHFDERIAKLKPLKRKAATKTKPEETDEELAYRESQRPQVLKGPEPEEAHEVYAARVREHFLKPERFGRREIILDADRIEQCERTEWAYCKMILHMRQDGHFPQNPNACNNWGRVCEYHRICSNPCNAEEIIKEDFKHKPAHEELEENQNVQVSNHNERAEIHTGDVDSVLPRRTGGGEIDLRV